VLLQLSLQALGQEVAAEEAWGGVTSILLLDCIIFQCSPRVHVTMNPTQFFLIHLGTIIVEHLLNSMRLLCSLRKKKKTTMIPNLAIILTL
jgi:hypothetical protein